MDQDLQQLGDRLLRACARRNLSPDAAAALVGCAVVLLHRVRPGEERVLRAVSALRSLGAETSLEQALLGILSRSGS